MATVDVVVVAYNSRDALAACLSSLHRAEGVGRVVVVDHGEDGSGAIARAAGATAIANPANPGFGAGQNRGVAATDAPFVLLLNPDATMVAGALAAGLRILEDQHDVAAVQGVVVNRTTGEPERSQGVELGAVHLVGRAVGARRLLGIATLRSWARRFARLSDHADRVPPAATDVESLAATALLVRRSAFEDVGGFDAGYFLYGEDLDLCRRLRRSGWRLVALPEPWAVHEGGSSAGTPGRREILWWRGTMRFAAQWWDGRAWSVAVAAAAVRAVRLAVVNPRSARRAWRSLVSDPVADRRRFACRPPVPPPSPARRAGAAVSAGGGPCAV
jgi:GT2 family glycosyltransferase